jgi:quercetin dioxygenase-like cupin family protein
MTNVLKDVPYQDQGMGRRKLVDEKHLLVMQAALKPGQVVPQHDANSNVHLLCVEGAVIVTLAGKDVPLATGDLLPVAFRTTMSIRNDGKENASFLIIKTPNPSEMEK